MYGLQISGDSETLLVSPQGQNYLKNNIKMSFTIYTVLLFALKYKNHGG